MKTCRRFTAIREDFEQEIGYLSAHAEQHAGTSAAKTSAKQALSAKQRMSRALSWHVERCPECG